jgi:hypothetical protein
MKDIWGDKRQWNTWDNERFSNGRVAFEVTSKEGTWNHGYFKGSKREINSQTGEIKVSVPLQVKSLEGPRVQFETDAVLLLKVGKNAALTVQQRI